MRRITIASLLVLAGSLASGEPGKSAEARSTATPSTEASVQTSVTTASTANVARRFVTVAGRNAARYRIREQLVGVRLPNDAVGETKGVDGVIAVDAKGHLIPAASKFTVDVSTLTSDKDRRDEFVKRRVLETEQYPSATFALTSIRRISLPFPAAGARSFDVVGDLTVRGTTRATTWKVNAEFQPGKISGRAVTAITFSDFGIVQPRVPVLLSVADTIKLELDFSLLEEDGQK